MSRRDWILAAIFAAALAAWFWQHERWHDLNKRTAVLKAETDLMVEMCRSLKAPTR